MVMYYYERVLCDELVVDVLPVYVDYVASLSVYREQQYVCSSYKAGLLQ